MVEIIDIYMLCMRLGHYPYSCGKGMAKATHLGLYWVWVEMLKASYR
jgi:hypothetical protein